MPWRIVMIKLDMVMASLQAMKEAWKSFMVVTGVVPLQGPGPIVLILPWSFTPRARSCSSQVNKFGKRNLSRHIILTATKPPIVSLTRGPDPPHTKLSAAKTPPWLAKSASACSRARVSTTEDMPFYATARMELCHS